MGRRARQICFFILSMIKVLIFFCFVLFFCDLQMVAVKQLAQDGVQGSHEFLIEVLMLTMLNHKNLVCLVGFCAQGDERLLVYEYMPFGSLESHLFGKLLSNFLCMFGQFRFLSVLAQTTHLRWNVCLSFLFLLCYSAPDSIVCCRKTKSLFPPFFLGMCFLDVTICVLQCTFVH
jgi:hypothetical protein